MESKDKFIEYLEELRDKTISKIVIERKKNRNKVDQLITDYIEIKKVLDTVSIKEKRGDIGRMDRILGLVSKYIQASPLSARERVEVLISELKINIDNGITSLENMVFIDPRIEEKYDVTIEEIQEILENNDYERLLNENDKNLSKRDLVIKKALENCVAFSDSEEEIKNIIRAHKKIEKYYFSRKEIQKEKIERKLSQTDIDYFIEGLEELDVDSNLCQSARYLLEKNLTKRNKGKQEQPTKKFLEYIETCKENGARDIKNTLNVVLLTTLSEIKPEMLTEFLKEEIENGRIVDTILLKITNNPDINMKELINSLHKQIESIIPKEILEQYMESLFELYINLSKLQRMTKMSKEEWKKEDLVSSSFYGISFYLEDSSLSAREKFHVLMSLIEKNIPNGILDRSKETIVVDDDNLGTNNYYTRTQIDEMLTSEAYLSLLDRDNSELTPQEIVLKNDLSILLDQSIIEERADALVKNYRQIKKHYFDKKVIDENGIVQIDLSQEDIEKVMDSLDKFGIKSDLYQSIKYLLEKDLKKRQKQEENKVSHSIIGSKEPTKKLLTDKEYKQKKKEIKKYFNTYTGEVQRPLSNEEVLYCAHLMLEIDEHPDIIRKLFMRTGQEIANPITKFVQQYDKLKYYEEKLGLEDSIKIMQESFQELFIANDEDYLFWKNVINQELNKAESHLSGKYEYELEQAKNYNTSKVKKMK